MLMTRPCSRQIRTRPAAWLVKKPLQVQVRLPDVVGEVLRRFPRCSRVSRGVRISGQCRQGLYVPGRPGATRAAVDTGAAFGVAAIEFLPINFQQLTGELLIASPIAPPGYNLSFS